MVLAELRTFLLDSYRVLPLLLVGLMFFFGVMTSNVGMIMTVLGALIFVPTLVILSNSLGNPRSFFSPFQPVSAAQYIGLPLIFSVLFERGINTFVDKSDPNNKYTFFTYLTPIVFWILPFFSNMPPLKFLNPVAWFSPSQTQDAVTKSAVEAGKHCSLLPTTTGEPVFRNPSYWLAYTLFFLGFLMSNAAYLLTLPAATPTSPVSATTQAQLDKKAADRKSVAIFSLVLLSAVFLAIIGLRYFATDCDVALPANSLTLLLIAFAGALWFRVLTIDCGVRATDIFGIITTFIPPTTRNPIVCTA
jgi:hypothetical protein